MEKKLYIGGEANKRGRQRSKKRTPVQKQRREGISRGDKPGGYSLVWFPPFPGSGGTSAAKGRSNEQENQHEEAQTTERTAENEDTNTREKRGRNSGR